MGRIGSQVVKRSKAFEMDVIVYDPYITEETAKVVLENIKQLKATAEKVEENYKRISYIMFLLDMPNRKKKRDRYKNQNKKLLNKIPNKDTLEGIQEENNKNLNELKTYIDC